MPWRQHSTWLPRSTAIRWLLNLSASGDHADERRAVRKLVNISYDGFGEAK
jgi:hypothetical protein